MKESPKNPEEALAWKTFKALRDERDRFIVKAEKVEAQMNALAEKWGWEGA